MARAVNGIDLVVGGHTQNPACMKAENVLDRAYVPASDCKPDRQNGTWIVQAHEWGKYVGRADFEYRNGKFTLVKYALLPVNLKRAVKNSDGTSSMVNYAADIPEDNAMIALLKPYQEFGQKRLLIEVGSSDAKLEGDRAVVRTKPTALGSMIGQAMMLKSGADFAVVNAGGVRESLPAGKINYKDVLTVHPFGNTIATVVLTGSEVQNYLTAAAKMSPGSGAFPQFAGIRLNIASGVVSNVQIRGKPLDMAESYRMAINNFVAAGGDGYPKLTAHPSYVDTGFVDADVLRAFITARSPLNAASFEPGDSITRQ
jgi:5'-nucleotidase/UDP-sugar diphosphatase